jgi:hypothetical protein
MNDRYPQAAHLLEENLCRFVLENPWVETRSVDVLDVLTEQQELPLHATGAQAWANG